MKKMRRITAVICAVILAMACLVMTGCGGAKYADSKYVGKWVGTSAVYSGFEMGVEEILGGEFTFTLDENGKVTMKVVDKEETGKWEETEDGIKFDGDEEMAFKYDDDKLSVDYSGVTIYFEKE